LGIGIPVVKGKTSGQRLNESGKAAGIKYDTITDRHPGTLKSKKEIF